MSGKPTGYDQNEVVKTKFFELVGTDKELVDMLGHVKITLLPMENPNGRDIVEVRALQNCAASMFWLIVVFLFLCLRPRCLMNDSSCGAHVAITAEAGEAALCESCSL